MKSIGHMDKCVGHNRDGLLKHRDKWGDGWGKEIG